MGPGKLLGASGKELTRLEVVQAVADRRMLQREAAGRLGVSVRQVKHLVRAYRREEASGPVSRRRGLAEKAHFVALGGASLLCVDTQLSNPLVSAPIPLVARPSR